MNQQKLRADAHKQIEEIFKTLLPARGLSYREAQAQLSHTMLDALLDGKIALCDAGTGIGKTFSYLVAGAVFDQARCRDGCTHQPLIISTSSIALQRAVKYEYLPLLSSGLLDAGYQKKPLLAVIRKGRSHYVCDQRLEKRLWQLSGAKKNAMSREALEHLQKQLDLDEAEPSVTMIGVASVYQRFAAAGENIVATGPISKTAILRSTCSKSATTICCLRTPCTEARACAPSPRNTAVLSWMKAISSRR